MYIHALHVYTHIHTYIDIYIIFDTYMCVCVCAHFFEHQQNLPPPQGHAFAVSSCAMGAVAGAVLTRRRSSRVAWRVTVLGNLMDLGGYVGGLGG